jgi:hypothetical protein
MYKNRMLGRKGGGGGLHNINTVSPGPLGSRSDGKF